MIQRVFTLFFCGCILSLGYIFFQSPKEIKVKAETKVSKRYIIEHKINSPSQKAYSGCKWEWVTLFELGIWKQVCQIGTKTLSLVGEEQSSTFYYAIDSGDGYKSQELALQVFRFERIDSVEEILDNLYIELLKGGFIKLEWACDFKKTDSPHKFYPSYQLVSEKMGKKGKQICGDYGFNSRENKYFLIIKQEKSKAVFINQVQKNIFDIQSLSILD